MCLTMKSLRSSCAIGYTSADGDYITELGTVIDWNFHKGLLKARLSSLLKGLF
jgi:hypothetical protein